MPSASANVETLPATLKIVQRIAAGQPPAGPIGAGEAARIFTGAQVPPGADTIVIQENCDETGDHVTVREGNRKLGQHIRKAGLDFAHRRHRPAFRPPPDARATSASPPP